MNERDKQLIDSFDQLDHHLTTKQAVDPEQHPEIADLVQIVSLIEQQPRPLMPRGTEFRNQVMTRIKPRRSQAFWWQASLAMAAVLLIGFLWLRPEPQTQTIFEFDQAFLEKNIQTQTRSTMVQYFRSTERLLMSLRDYELKCSDDQIDFNSEKDLAKDLLLRHQSFVAQMDRPEYLQAKGLLKQLERILTDVNMLDNCSDMIDVDLLNRHINDQRILNKLRLMTREIQIT